MKKNILFVLFILFSALKISAQTCHTLPVIHRTVKDHCRKFRVLLTAYWPAENDPYTRKHIGARGDHLKFGVAAVNFLKIPYGSCLRIDGIKTLFKCYDTGSAIVSRKAARLRGLNCLVVDLFFENRFSANNFLDKHGELAYCSLE